MPWKNPWYHHEKNIVRFISHVEGLKIILTEGDSTKWYSHKVTQPSHLLQRSYQINHRTVILRKKLLSSSERVALAKTWPWILWVGWDLFLFLPLAAPKRSPTVCIYAPWGHLPLPRDVTYTSQMRSPSLNRGRSMYRLNSGEYVSSCSGWVIPLTWMTLRPSISGLPAGWQERFPQQRLLWNHLRIQRHRQQREPSRDTSRHRWAVN